MKISRDAGVSADKLFFSDGVSAQYRLMNLRKAARLTRQDVADLAGIDRTSYSRIESGYRVPTVDIAIRIAKLFDTTVEKIFSKE